MFLGYFISVETYENLIYKPMPNSVDIQCRPNWKIKLSILSKRLEEIFYWSLVTYYYNGNVLLLSDARLNMCPILLKTEHIVNKC